MMRMTGLIVLIMLAGCVFSAQAAFESADLAPESVKLGDASASLIKGAENIYDNPAGLSELKNREIGLLYSRMMLNLDNDDLNIVDLVLASPFHGFAAALSFNRFSSRLYYEQVFSFAGAVKLINNFRGTLSLGLRTKLLQIGYVQNDYASLSGLFLTKGYSKFGIGFDAGAVYESKSGFNFGVKMKNINVPDMTLAATGNGLPITLSAGVSYSWNLRPGDGFVRSVLLACDGSVGLSGSEDASVHFGLESGIGSGEIFPGAGFTAGSGSLSSLSAGISYRPKNPASGQNKVLGHLRSISYSFRYHLGGMDLGTYGDHLLFIGFWF
jgi:hypothetical protein